MPIDLDKLEMLHAEAAGTPYKAKGDWIYAQSVSHKRTFSRRPMAYTIDNRDGRYKPTETAAYIVAACNAVPELIAENRALQKRVQELEKQRNWLAQKHANACIDAACDACTSHIGDCPICPLPQGTGLCIEVSEVTFINAAEEAAKEAGNGR